MTVESYVQGLTDNKEISSTALTVKLHTYYTKHLQPVDYDKITGIINDLVEKSVICKKGDKYSSI
jgi:hypothetical protein